MSKAATANVDAVMEKEKVAEAPGLMDWRWKSKSCFLTGMRACRLNHSTRDHARQQAHARARTHPLTHKHTYTHTHTCAWQAHAYVHTHTLAHNTMPSNIGSENRTFRLAPCGAQYAVTTCDAASEVLNPAAVADTTTCTPQHSQ